MKRLMMVMSAFFMCAAGFSSIVECSLDGEKIFSLDTYKVTATLSWQQKIIELTCSKNDWQWTCENEEPSSFTYVVEMFSTIPAEATVRKFSGALMREEISLTCATKY